MERCTECGKIVLFSRLSYDGLCKQCKAKQYAANKAAYEATYEREKQKEYQDALQFIREMTPYVKKALSRSVVFPALGKKTLIEQKKACDFVVENIDNWKNYASIREALEGTCVCISRERVSYPVLGGSSFSQYDEVNLGKEFEKVKKAASELSTACYLASLKAYDYSKVVTVVGVTFRNGRRQRQTILRQIRFHDPPYKSEPEIRLERYLCEGEDAIAVYADTEQVGNISRADLPFFLEHWDEYSGVDEFDVKGGTDTSFGLDIRAVFAKKED